jgi:hypothetical protein
LASTMLSAMWREDSSKVLREFHRLLTALNSSGGFKTSQLPDCWFSRKNLTHLRSLPGAFGQLSTA